MMKDVIKRFQKRTGKKTKQLKFMLALCNCTQRIANGIRGHTHIHMHVLIIINVAVVVTVTALAVPTNECFYCSRCSYVAHEQTCYLIESICFFFTRKKNLMIFCQNVIKSVCHPNVVSLSENLCRKSKTGNVYSFRSIFINFHILPCNARLFLFNMVDVIIDTNSVK